MNREEKMGRLRIWIDNDLQAGLAYIRPRLRKSASQAVGAAVALLWLALAEREEGRRIVSLNPDGTINKDIF